MSGISDVSTANNTAIQQQVQNPDPAVLQELLNAIQNQTPQQMSLIQQYGEQLGLRQAYINDLKTYTANFDNTKVALSQDTLKLHKDEGALGVLNIALQGYEFEYQKAKASGDYQLADEIMDENIKPAKSQIQDLQNNQIPNDQKSISQDQDQLKSIWDSITAILPNS